MATCNTRTKDLLADALLELMATKPLAQISVSELTGRAQVNRASFYRNFASKEDVLLFRFNERLRAWTSEHTVMESTDGSPYLQARGFFEFMLSQRALVEQLFGASVLDMVLLDYLASEIGPAVGDSATEVFYRSHTLYGMFGIYREWVKHGMKESPDEIAYLVVYGVRGEHPGLMRD